MKQFFGLIIVAAALCLTPSCKEGVDNDGKTLILQDSVVTVLATWQALKIKVDDNKTQMNVIVGDATFYKASAEEKGKKALELGRMIIRIYGANSYLEKGNLIVTNDVKNNSETPADGISTPIDFVALKKEAGGK